MRERGNCRAPPAERKGEVPGGSGGSRTGQGDGRKKGAAGEAAPSSLDPRVYLVVSLAERKSSKAASAKSC